MAGNGNKSEAHVAELDAIRQDTIAVRTIPFSELHGELPRRVARMLEAPLLAPVRWTATAKPGP